MVSYWKSQTIYAAIKLNILEELAKKPYNIRSLARKLNLNLNALKRLIKGLQILGLVINEDEQFSLSSDGKLFTEHHPSSLKFASLIWGDEHFNSWHDLPKTIQTGQAAFEQIYGRNFFQWLNDHPLKLDIYHKAISIYAQQDYAKIPMIYDFSCQRKILDLGGGIGILLANILTNYPHLKGILLEQNLVIQAASEFLENKGVLSRCTLISRSFFEKIPVKCDAIIMSRILHDWNDKNCLRILQNCYNALEDNGNVYIIEIIHPDNIIVDKGVFLNLNMLVITGGKERTKNEFQELLDRANFILKDIKPINSFLSLIIATKTRS